MPIEKYKIYQSKVILDNYEDFLTHTEMAYELFKEKYKIKDSTWSYNHYNIFSLTAASDLYYELYKELCSFIKDYIGKDMRIWMEAWLNYHSYEDIKSLDWHGHEYTFHGYVAIDPKNTITEFKDFKIKNIPGQVYIGLGHRGMEHRVVAEEKWEGHRTTLAFDCTIKDNEFHPNNMLFPII